VEVYESAPLIERMESALATEAEPITNKVVRAIFLKFIFRVSRRQS
jgi:hypothetical protein